MRYKKGNPFMGNEKDFKIECQARWADMDPNSHMRNTAFLDYAADARMLFFKSHGFSMARFARLELGPIALRDSIEYRKELGLYEPFFVHILLGEMTDDGSRFSLVNEFRKADGKLAARLETQAAWFNQRERKITSPPADLLAILAGLKRAGADSLS